MDPSAVVDRIQDSLMSDPSLPRGFLATVLGSPALRDALQGYRDEAVDVLTHRPPDMESRLATRKTAIVRALPESHYSLERLLARASQEILSVARSSST